MAEMSPLARILMIVLHRGAWFAMVLLLLFAGILLYQRWTPAGLMLQKGETGFLGVLGVLFALAVYLIWGIGKELRRPGA